jgi:hypothetical protein
LAFPGIVLTSTVLLKTVGAMSMPSLPFRVSFRVQSTWPSAGSRANADVSVAPNTLS